MNTRQSATHGILSFLESDQRFLLLTGTYQNEKHVLALSTILSKYPSPASILFRANHSTNIQNFLAPVLNLTKEPRTGTPIHVDGYTLYVDTINPMSWSSSPSEVDVAMVYPIDSLEYESGDDCVQDLISRKAKKILLVSWTDDKDFGWATQFSPIHVIFDAEEDDPDYHRRMVEMLTSVPRQQITEKLPEYASAIPQQYLIKILCRGRCHTTRWAKLNAPYPGRSAMRSAQMGRYTATCLKCGYEATDNYNWFR